MNRPLAANRVWPIVLTSVLVLAVSVSVTLLFAPGRRGGNESDRLVRDFSFEDANGATVRLADFQGRSILLNVWATWCVPCRREMPMLDRVQDEFGGPDFEVVALSIDRGGTAAIEAFYAEYGLTNLAIYADIAGQSRSALGLVGMPTTLLIDPDGREVTRVIGPAEWDGPEMLAMIRDHLAAIADPNGAARLAPTVMEIRE